MLKTTKPEGSKQSLTQILLFYDIMIKRHMPLLSPFSYHPCQFICHFKKKT